MAKLIYAAFTSLDGYVADETGNFDWAELGVPAQRIGEIVAGKRAITADTDLSGTRGQLAPKDRRRPGKMSVRSCYSKPTFSQQRLAPT